MISAKAKKIVKGVAGVGSTIVGGYLMYQLIGLHPKVTPWTLASIGTAVGGVMLTAQAVGAPSDKESLLKGACAAGMSAIAAVTGYEAVRMLLRGIPPEFTYLLPLVGSVSICTGVGAAILGRQALKSRS